jgi:hypothetical protein
MPACWVSRAAKHPTQLPHDLELLGREEDLLAAGARGVDVDGREDARSASCRSSLSSMLPVPLNSSKITSSMREPVSTSAVARMVSEPPFSMLRAAPKNFFGG